MRNKYGGTCYYCGKYVNPNEGHFERYKGGWRTIHSRCVLAQRNEKSKNSTKKIRRRRSDGEREEL